MPTFPFGLPNTTVDPEIQPVGLHTARPAPKTPFPGSRAANVTTDPQRDKNTNPRKANDLPTGLPNGNVTRDPLRDRDTAQTNNTNRGGAYKIAGSGAPGNVDPEQVQRRELAVPTAPTAVTATAGAGQATVSFKASASARKITGYTVTSTPGSKTATGTKSPITVTGLTAGTAYTFKVVATNSNGSSPQSAASGSVTPT
jgi:hypothetical protein